MVFLLDDSNEFAYYVQSEEGRFTMQPDFQVESRSYDHMYRGSWRGYRLDTATRLSNEEITKVADDCVLLWLPAGTPMHWAIRTRPLRYHCVQLYWPERWYTLSAFYDDRSLIHTYASIIQPAVFEERRLVYVDLDLSLLIKPDLSFEVLTQAEFDQFADTLGYSEETRIGALLALETLTQSARLAMGLFAAIPHTLRQVDFRLTNCYK
jgi:protein associated with RNAse G/E